jgi:beta-N-acetylhexosaminidase
MRPRLHILLFLAASLAWVLWATLYREPQPEAKTVAPFLESDSGGIDSMLSRMSTRQRLAQLILVQPTDNQPASFFEEISSLPQPGGLWTQAQSPTQMRAWQREAHQQNGIPLLMAGTGGSEAMLGIPHNASSLAINDDQLLREWGLTLGQQYRALGYHLYVVPGLFDHLQEKNRPHWFQRSQHLINGLQSARVLAVVDGARPYYPLATNSPRLDGLLWPYQSLGKVRTSGLMIDPVSVSKIKWNSPRQSIIRSFLNEQAQFEGLVLTRLQKGKPLEDQVMQMCKAGSDLMVVPQGHYEAVINTLEELLVEGDIAGEELAERVKRILRAKKWAGAGEGEREARPAFAKEELPWLQHRIAQASISLLKNQNRAIPPQRFTEKKPYLITVGSEAPYLQRRWALYGPFTPLQIQAGQDSVLPPLPLAALKKANPAVIILTDPQLDTLRHRGFWRSLQSLRMQTEVWIVHGGALTELPKYQTFPVLLQTFGWDSLYQDITAQVIMGGLSPGGKLPLKLGEGLAFGQGLHTAPTRLAYYPPEAVGMDRSELAMIDSILLEGIENSAMPGAQVLVAKAGKVVYHKGIGFHTYQQRRPVQLTDLYDIASVTKIAATTLAAMKLTDEQKLMPQHRLDRFFQNRLIEIPPEGKKDTVYLNEEQLAELPPKDSISFSVQFASQRDVEVHYDSLRMGDSLRIIRTILTAGKNIRAPIFRLRIADLLTHYSGLPKGLPILPFLNYRDSTTGKYDRYYQPELSEEYGIGVAADYFLRNDYRDTLWEAARHTLPYYDPFYEYSDFNMIMVQQAIDSLNEEPIDLYLDRSFYQALGMQQTMYLPREKVEYSRIVPTEYDHRWRGQLLRGYVHDPTAALLGGISGNAGLFSSANDLAILFQMILNGGTYGGARYLSPATIETYTQRQRGHRGYGFDKPPLTGKENYIIAPSASTESYGHTGFTGTCVWVDPEEELVFVFLSNRVHPSARNWKLNEMRIRQRVHEQVYRAMKP